LEVKILARSTIILSIAIKEYFAKSISNNAKVVLASFSEISFVRTFYQIVELNAVFAISDK